jgi:thiol:disulfide interchange protein DsbD
MMLRVLLFVLLAGTCAARASDKIDAPADGASAVVTQPHVTAELIPESTTVEAGKPFDVALHLHADDGWHTYWVNPGDAGLATTIKWTLPDGFTAGPIQWPTPEKHAMGPLMTYGYSGDVYLLTTITPPKSDLPQHFDIKAKAAWLVCQEECVPGKAELSLTLDSGFMNLRLPKENTELFAEARKRLPVENTVWNVAAAYRDNPNAVADPKRGPAPQTLALDFKDKSGAPANLPHGVSFFPEQPNVLSTQDADATKPDGSSLDIVLEQNGDKPDKLSGVLVSAEPLIGDAKAVQIAEFPVMSDAHVDGGLAPVNATSSEPGAGPAPATFSNATPPSGANATEPAAQRAAATELPSAGPQPLLIAVLGAAFVGGLILNLMPCVLPVLSLKVFSLIRHAGDNPKAAWVQGVAFTVGVVISFWILAGALLALRAAGNHLGWGFQMQSPGFVAALIVLFFLIGLNLFGVFEIGSSLVGLDAKASSHAGGSVSSFLNGALATVAATPCTAPFMGSALGFAAQQPAYISLLIFTFLALGMATPYLLLTIFPGALRFVPKPGAWMEAFKQFMGFLLMATVIFLLYVFGALVGQDEVPGMLAALLVAGIAAWIYGRWGGPAHSGGARAAAMVLTVLILAYAIHWGIALASAKPPEATASSETAPGGWQPWTPAAVDAALAQDRPVFVDFTAAWCLSCKVNERVALETDEVKAAFAKKNVALFRADWTHADPAITATLRKYQRDGVPLYLLYSPKAKDAPEVLPEVLTPGIVLEAVGKI